MVGNQSFATVRTFIPTSVSSTWRRIHYVLKLMEVETTRRIGNGKDTLF